MATNPYDGNPTCTNPYYDCSADEGGGGGGTPPDLSSYAKKTEVKDYDEVAPLSSDTKKTGTIYIGSDNKLYLWNGSSYVPTTTDDSNLIPIKRNDCNKNNAPQDGELHGFLKVKNCFSLIYLDCATEAWQYNGTSWVKLFEVENTGGFKTLEISNTTRTIGATDTENVYICRATTQDTSLTLPSVEDVQDRVYIFKGDTIDDGRTVEIKPNGGDKIDNANSSLFLKRSGDSVAVISDGDEWHIIEKHISSALPDGEINYLIGDFVYKYRGGMSDEDLENIGYFPLVAGTYTDYKTKYPLASQRMPQAWISGNDWVIPNLDGVFLRNLGGNAGNEGVKQSDEFKSHTHGLHYFADGSKRFGNGNTYGDYLVRRDSDRQTSPSGGAETRPVNIALQLCLVVDTIGKAIVLPDTVDVAHSVTITANGGSTQINGKASETIYAGVGAYRLLVEVPQGKMIDPLGAGEWTLIDAHQGIIEFQLDRNYSSNSKDLTVSFMDLTQEGLLNTTYIFTGDRTFHGSTEAYLFETDNYTKKSGTKLEISVRLPYRNNDDTWGGVYTHLRYSVDNGATYKKFFNSGYDTVMYSGSGAIESFNYTSILEIEEIVNSEQVKFKVTATTYNNKTAYLNRNHGIQGVDTSTNYGYANFSIKEIGTLYGVNPNYDNAPLSKLTFTGITAENGQTELILLEGNIYHVKMDLEPSKRIFSVNSTNPQVKASIVDSENGFIAVDMPIGGGDSNIAVNVENKPMRTNEYALSSNPEGLTNFDFCVLYNHNIGSSPIVDYGDDSYFQANPKPILTEGLGEPFGNNYGQGIGGACYDLRKERHFLASDGWNLNKRGFVISFWAKAYESVDSLYFLGNNKTGSNNQAIHVGWRDLNRFTLAFWGNDVNWTNPLGKKRYDFTDKWTSYILLHDTVAKKSKLWVNGQYISEATHPSGQYTSYVSMVLGTTNTARTKARISNIRFMVGKYNQSGYLLTDNQAQNIYVQEKKVLEDLR